MKKNEFEYLVEFWQGNTDFHTLSLDRQTSILFEFLSLVATEARNTFACLLPNSGPLIIYETSSTVEQKRVETLITGNILAPYFRRMATSPGHTPAAAYITGLTPVHQIIHLSSDSSSRRSNS